MGLFGPPPSVDPLALPPGFNHYLAYVSAGFFFFVVVNGITSRYVVPDAANHTRKQRWKWSNIFTSLVHSSMAALWAPLVFFLYPDMRREMIDSFNTPTHVLVSFSVGYFAYDFMDMALYNPKRSTYELLLHHASVIACFGLAASTKMFLPYVTTAIIVEINSVFLHTRQLLVIQGVSRQSVTYRKVALLNVATFVLFRVLTLGWMTRWMAINRDLVGTRFFVCGSAGLLVVIVMNAVLFYRILRTDFFRTSEQPKSSRCESDLLGKGGFHPVSRDVNRIMRSFFDNDDDGQDDEVSKGDLGRDLQSGSHLSQAELSARKKMD